MRPTVSGQSFWQQALLASDQQKADLYLQAASRFLASGKFIWAKRALDAVAVLPLTDNQEQAFSLLRADSLLQQHRYAEAGHLLPNWSEVSSVWPKDQQLQWCHLQAQIAQGQARLKETVVAWQRLADQYDPSSPNYQHALAMLWRALVVQPAPVLRQMRRSLIPGSVSAGWLDLALLVATQGDLNDNSTVLQAWLARYPDHPAKTFLGRKKRSLPWREVKKVALLLPLSGRFSEQGQAIRRGFYAAYYAQEKKHADSLPDVALYDTGSAPAESLAKQAAKEGASLIIGPLLKKNVEAVYSADVSIPVLALNEINKARSSWYEFALNPTIAATMIADRLAREGRWHVAVITDKTPWAQRMLDAFKKHWSDANGVVVAHLLVSDDPSRSLSASMKKLLQVSASLKRERQVARKLHKKLRFVASRREDIDAFVLFTRQQDAQQIKPFLRYYFAGDVPVYAGPSVYDRHSSVASNGDLNGIQFLSTPWQVMPNRLLPPLVADVRKVIRKSWPSLAKKQARFFAMGVDSFSLITRLPWLAVMPDLSFFGGTGILSVGDEQQIKRQLTWAQFSRGYVKPIHVAS